MRLFHGDNQLVSREALFKEKEKSRVQGLELVELVDKNISLGEVKQAVESAGLFGNDRVLVLEGLFSGQSNKNKKEVIEYLKRVKPENVIIWEGKKIDGRKLSGWQAEEFKVSTVVFKFLEAVRPGEQRQWLSLWETVLKTEPVELVFFLLVRQVRQLIGVTSSPETFKGAPWLVNKLKQQGKFFGLVGLLKLHGRLCQLEIETKTGSGVLPLETRLEMMLMGL